MDCLENKVAVLIPVYNGEEFLKETVDSILCQIGVDVEVHIADDISSDNSVALLHNHYGKDSRVNVYVNIENLGLSKNANFLFSKISSGVKYVMAIGQDDMIPEDHLYKAVTFLNSNPDYSIFHCNSTLIDEKSKEIGKNGRDDNRQLILTQKPLLYLSTENFISSTGLVCRASDWKAVEGWDTTYKFYGEWMLWIKLCTIGKAHYSIDTKALYRKHTTSLSAGFRDRETFFELNRFQNECKKEAYRRVRAELSFKEKWFYNKHYFASLIKQVYIYLFKLKG